MLRLSTEGVGELYPSCLADKDLRMSFATTLARTLTSDFFATTHLAWITRALGDFCFKASTWVESSNFPALHFSILEISSTIPSKQRSTSTSASMLSSTAVDGFQTSTLPLPSSTKRLWWSTPGSNLIDDKLSTKTVGFVAATRNKQCTCNTVSSGSTVSSQNKPNCGSFSTSTTRSRFTSFSTSPISPSCFLLVLSLNSSSWGMSTSRKMFSSGLSGAIDGDACEEISTSRPTRSWATTSGIGMLIRRHFAECLIPGATIPDSHAGQPLVKIRPTTGVSTWSDAFFNLLNSRPVSWVSTVSFPVSSRFLLPTSTCASRSGLRTDFGGSRTGGKPSSSRSGGPSSKTGLFLSSSRGTSPPSCLKGIKNESQRSVLNEMGVTSLMFLAENCARYLSPSTRILPWTIGPWSMPTCKNAGSMDLVSLGFFVSGYVGFQLESLNQTMQ